MLRTCTNLAPPSRSKPIKSMESETDQDTRELESTMELTADVIKRRSGHYDVSLVALLDVSRMRIRYLAQLEFCLNLLELNLAHNELRSLDGLPSLPLLRCLDISNNQLTSLDNLPRLPMLEELTIANQIRSIDFTALSTKLPSLRVLDFSGNPIDSRAEAKASKAFPDLFILNGEALTLTRLLEEISADDFGKSTSTSDEDDPSLYAELTDGLESDTMEDDDIGVKEFISESTRNLQELLQRCKATVEAADAEVVLAASPSV
ncbi:hypothetical protein PF008_g7558 [Phytophthora fragariae]|uniref:U2A'/phosphoprotein 32 family A C-terminal domain-containing protein n=1 Tax=Phytophthora fragariae TaxID=53985 RepID=A0A6G0S243_9STRA|nr:hypothetical protein PF008_g7558 [Phytophthora fragariae]